MQGLKLKQKQLKSEYMKLYRRLDKYGQAPVTPLSHPWQRDIRRLRERWATVKKYASVYRRYQKSVTGFNEKYMQKAKMREPHTNINTQTLSTLERSYEEWKKYRKKFVRTIAREDETIYRQLINLLDRAKMFLTPNKFTGDYSDNDYRIKRNIDTIEDLVHASIPDGQPERRIKLQQIKKDWEMLVEAVMIYIYDSEQIRRQEAWAKIVFILSGVNDLFTDIEDLPEEDLVYE